jgi:outer membrane receptor protein involved in Fe transport
VPFSSEEGTFLQCFGPATVRIPGIPCVNAAGVPTAADFTRLATGGLVTQLPYTSVFENQGRNRTVSVFADATFIPVPALELTAGVRYLRERRRSGFFARVPRLQINPAALSLIPTQIDTAGQTFEATRTFDAWLPRFNALLRLNDRVNVFGTVSKGRRSPVVSLNAIRVAGLPAPNLQVVPEENVWNYEVGLKGSAGIVSGTLGIFYQKYDGFQVSVIQPDGRTVTQSAGTASNLGVEAEVSARVTRWMSLFGNVAYIDGGIDENQSFAPAFSGARFRLQPEWQSAAGFTVDAPVGNGIRVFATPSITYRSRIFFELPNNPRISQDAVTLLNVRGGVSFADERFELAAFLRNALNEDYLLDAGNTGGGFGIPTFIPAEPRFYGVQLTARFR